MSYVWPSGVWCTFITVARRSFVPALLLLLLLLALLLSLLLLLLLPLLSLL